MLSTSRRLAWALSVFILLLPTFSFAQGAFDHFEVRLEGAVITPDTINGTTAMVASGSQLRIVFSAQNVAPGWSGGSAPFEFYSPDASVINLIYVDGPNFLAGITEYEGPWLGQGVEISRLDGTLPDSVIIGFLLQSPAFHLPAVTDIFEIIYEIPEDAEGIICVDSAFFPPSGEWAVTPFDIELQWGEIDGAGYPDGGVCFTVAPGLSCCDLPGDANNDGNVNIVDVTFIINRIFNNGPPAPCCQEADVTQNAGAIGDVTYLVAYIFIPGAMAPECGPIGVSCSPQ